MVEKDKKQNRRLYYAGAFSTRFLAYTQCMLRVLGSSLTTAHDYHVRIVATSDMNHGNCHGRSFHAYKHTYKAGNDVTADINPAWKVSGSHLYGRGILYSFSYQSDEKMCRKTAKLGEKRQGIRFHIRHWHIYTHQRDKKMCGCMLDTTESDYLMNIREGYRYAREKDDSGKGDSFLS